MKKLLSFLCAMILCFMMVPTIALSVGDFVIENGILKQYTGSGGDVIIPSDVKAIAEYAFKDCIGLTSVSIPDGVTSIGGMAFWSCENLKSVTMPSTMDSIDMGAFGYCTNLTSIVIPNGVERIGLWTFTDCSSLVGVTIPSSVTDIQKSAFENCPNLKIYGAAGSTAERYARVVGVPFAEGAAPESTISITGFSDVRPDSPYVDAINWAVANGITQGKTSSIFAPNEKCTVPQILTFLWRSKGSPEPFIWWPYSGGGDKNAYYYDAVRWACEEGIIPNDKWFPLGNDCTREMAMMYLWKAAGSPAATSTSNFSDVPRNSEYAGAIDWGVEKGITSGTSKTTFSPSDVCTRGQIVTLLYRSMNG